MPESFFSADQIVGSHSLEYHLEDEPGPKNVICTKQRRKREMLEKVGLTLSVGHGSLIDTGWECEPLVLKMTLHFLRLT